jgi:hypothetical protein
MEKSNKRAREVLTAYMNIPEMTDQEKEKISKKI